MTSLLCGIRVVYGCYAAARCSFWQFGRLWRSVRHFAVATRWAHWKVLMTPVAKRG